MAALNNCGQDCTLNVDPADYVTPKLAELRDCLCEALANTLDGQPARCCIQHGTEAVVDDCCSGTAWIRLISASPYTSFPTPALSRNRIDCPPSQWMMTVELGVARCACSLHDDGSPPDCCCMEDEVARAMSDRAAMNRAVFCCFADLVDCEITVGQYLPLSTTGGCLGGTIQVTFAFDECICEATLGPSNRQVC